MLPHVAKRMMMQAGGFIPWYLAGGVPAANCIAAYQPIGAASLATSYVNLANPGTNDAALGNAPTWNAATGWYADGVGAGWLQTGIVPLASWSMIVRVSGIDAGAANQVAAGSHSAVGPNFYVSPRLVGTVYYGGGTEVPGAGAIIDGTVAICGIHGYLNGSPDVDASALPGIEEDIYLLCLNNIGVESVFTKGYLLAVAIYDITLSAAQVLAIHNAMMAL